MARPEIERLFREYAAAALGPEAERTAAFYTPSFIAAGPAGSAVFANDERFLDWIRGIHDFNQQTGMEAMEVVTVAERPLSERHTIATVEWGARFRKTGSTLARFEITYLLEHNGEAWKILAYVSHADQEEEMRRLGLLQ
jgi:hypothetical protein